MLGHRLGKRCIARFSFAEQASAPEPWRPRSIIGKMYKMRSERGRQVFEAMRGLRGAGFGGGSNMAIPEPLAYVAEWQLLLMEDVAATPLPQVPAGQVSEAIGAAGRALARLHDSTLAVSEHHTVEDEIDILEGWVSLVSQVHPDLQAAATRALEAVRTELLLLGTSEPKLVHRDFYEKQVLVGDRTVLIDFDTLCLSDPALDLGNFLAHLKLAQLQKVFPEDSLADTFLTGYAGAASAVPTAPRIAAYTRSTFLRLACLHSFWPRWRHLAEALLDASSTDKPERYGRGVANKTGGSRIAGGNGRN